MQHFYSRIPGWFRFDALYREMVARAVQGARFVEVGSWKGRSAAFMAVEIINSGKKIEFYCVDHFKGSDEPAHHADKDVKANRLFDAFARNIAPVRGQIQVLQMSSVEAAANFTNASVDFLFLDGAHDYESVKADIAAWFPKMCTRSVIAGDDWNWKGVSTAVKESFGERVQVLGTGKGRHWKVELAP